MRYWIRPVRLPRVCYNSSLDREWNESSHGCVNTLSVDSVLSEGDPWTDALPLQLVIRHRLGEPPGVKRRPQYYPMGWNKARAALMIQRCSGEAGLLRVAEPVLLLLVPPPGLAQVGYQLLPLAC